MFSGADITHRAESYSMVYPDSTLVVMVKDGASPLTDTEIARVTESVRRILPDASAPEVLGFASLGDEYIVEAWPALASGATEPSSWEYAYQNYPEDQWDVPGPAPSGTPVTKSAHMLRLLGIPEPDLAASALDQGKLVVPPNYLQSDNTANLQWHVATRDSSGETEEGAANLPSIPDATVSAAATHGRWPANTSAILSPTTAAKHGLVVQDRAILFDLQGASPSYADLSSVGSLVNDTTGGQPVNESTETSVDQPSDQSPKASSTNVDPAKAGAAPRFVVVYDPGPWNTGQDAANIGWILMLITGALVLVLAWISTALTMMAGTEADTTWRVIVPWHQLGAMSAAAIVISMLVALLLTRAKLPMTRRID